MPSTQATTKQQPQDPVAARLGVFACYGALAIAVIITAANLLR